MKEMEERRGGEKRERKKVHNCFIPHRGNLVPSLPSSLFWLVLSLHAARIENPPLQGDVGEGGEEEEVCLQTHISRPEILYP